MAADDQLQIDIRAGEDFSAQVFFTDEYGEPVLVTTPCLLDVKDANGQIAMRFTDTTDPETDPHLTISGYVGFFQLTVPRTYTARLVPGRYVFDLWATTAEPSLSYATGQAIQVVSGWVNVLPRVSRIEDIISATSLTPTA